MERISCIFCGKPGNRIAISEHGYNGLKCENCNLIFVSPRPDATEIIGLYTEHHAVSYADAQFQFESFGRREAAKALSIISNYRKDGSILELGPGGGSFLLEARNFGYTPFGIELNPLEARWINERLGIPCESDPLTECSFAGRKFDIVYHKDVLSHLSDPVGVFRAINQSMNKTGLLVFETGNIADVKDKHYKWFSEFLYPDHLFFFGEKSLKILLERTEFSCLHIHRYAILLPLLLKRMLWRVKDPLKDKKTVEKMKLKKEINPARSRKMSAKRRLRLSYRYVSQYLDKFGVILPKKGWPLRLLVIAEKRSEIC